MIKKHIAFSILGLSPRDGLFTHTMNGNHFNFSSLNILQIGAIEEPTLRFKLGSGWSDIVFASYINLFGGKLTVVDINEEHLNNSKTVLNDFNIDHDLVLSDASDHIKNNKPYDVVYLDGSNDPEETEHQYNLLDKDSTSIIIIDDFKLKGDTIKFDERYSGNVHFVTNLGVYVGYNAKALEKVKKSVENSDLILDELFETNPLREVNV
jgi:hypothetical protein